MGNQKATPIPKILIGVSLILIAVVVTLALNLTTEGFANTKILIALGVIVLGVSCSAGMLLIAIKSKNLS